MESTRIVWGDGGRLPHPDGRPTHTFRSYTAFFRGIELRVRDLTIENDAGPGAKVGQAVAAYVDCSHTLFENVRLLSNQDTLFCAPLPEKEREKDGFLGPGRFAPRSPTASITGTARSREISILFLVARTLCLSSAPSAP